MWEETYSHSKEKCKLKLCSHTIFINSYWQKSKSSVTYSVDQTMGKQACLYITGRSIYWHNPFGRKFLQYLSKLLMQKFFYSCISLCYFSLVIFYDFSPCSFFYVTYLRSGLLFVWLPLNLCKRKPHIYSTPFSSVFILFPFPFTNLDFYSPLFCFCFYLYSNHIS